MAPSAVLTAPVQLRSDHGSAFTEGEVQIQTWDPQAQMKRAVKAGLACLGAAVVSVFLPLAHFVLVPGFLLASPFVFFFILKQESVVLGGKGTCPECQKPFDIVRSPNRFPMSDLCSHCKRPVRIELKK